MKKIIALMLFVCLMLVACGQNDGDDVESSKVESNAVESSNESSEESSEAESSESENESSDAESSEVSTESSEESSEASNEVESSEPVIESSEPVETSKPEVPSQPEVPEVPEVSEKPTEPTLAAWKQAYIDYIEDYHVREYGMEAYNLVYVDGDNIPELYLTGGIEASGDYVVSYKNGNIVDVHLDRTGGGRYIEKSGLFCNINGNMGYYYTHVYTLDNNGFTHILKSYSEELYNPIDDVLEISYYINNEPVSEEEFNTTIANAFDSSKAIYFYDNVKKYDEIKQLIMAY